MTTLAASHIHTGFAAQASLLDRARVLNADADVAPRALIIAFDLGNGAANHLVGLHVRVLESTGAVVESRILPAHATQADLYAHIDAANEDDAIDGILILIPVPPQIDFRAGLNRIQPVKDIEGVHPAHAVHMLSTSGESDLLFPRRPVVVDSFLELFADAGVSLDDDDLSVAIVSDVEIIDNNPLANLMVRAAAPAVFPAAAALSLVTLANPKTKDILRHADIVVVSLLRPRFLDRSWFKDGTVVLDFAPNVIGVKTLANGRQVPELCGGVDVDSVAGGVSKLFPIPSGIGPVMLGVLARNLAENAAYRRTHNTEDEVCSAAGG
ncbi:tetrahydrofolate dehydrogenase/cyclohydrolase catalytic domain-containing protein [Leifsonia sp. NPDC056665]|uniref:tetrahydrofolate dehydrogenase/cyclohydrolase catalytic domain-containing protein n=1 Tax=Leifsonia sp. NPDC056665 TaxID=3345901 RepID=UPI0036B124D3